MSLLEIPCTLVGPKGKLTLTVLFESGASVSCIRRDVAESLTHPEPLSGPFIVKTADKEKFAAAGYMAALEFFLEDAPKRVHNEFFVLDTLSEDLIIGATTMQQWNINLDFEAERVVYDRQMHRLRI